MNQIYENNSKAAASKLQKSFKTTDLAFTMGLIIIISSVTGGIVSQAFQDPQVAVAQADAERLAIATMTMSPEGLASDKRAPASLSISSSITEISKDPWGHPYHVKIMKGLDGATKVAVVSSGPNEKLETKLEKFEANHHPD